MLGVCVLLFLEHWAVIQANDMWLAEGMSRGGDQLTRYLHLDNKVSLESKDCMPIAPVNGHR